MNGKCFPSARGVRAVLCAAILGCNLMCIASEEPKDTRLRISAADLRESSVVIVGDLGVPLGTPAEVEGYVISAKNLMRVSLPNEFLLVIESVNGAKLESKPIFRFWVESGRKSLMANTESGLSRLLENLVGESEISQEIADRARINYEGIRRKLKVFESAVFTGRPADLRPSRPLRESRGMAFETYLVVVEPEVAENK